MAGMFGGGRGKVSRPKTVRMPTETDPELLAAQQRTREKAMNRSGRMSTIMTDQTRASTGSGGKKLGA